jgi:ribokinase
MAGASPIEVVVIGHIEWIEFARVEHVPRSGEIVHALETWEEPGGGGAVAAVQLAKLAGSSTMFTALGDDELGHRAKAGLEALGVRVEVAIRDRPTRRGFTYVDRLGERTITTIGDRIAALGEDPLPWNVLDAVDAVYFTAGDEGALRAGRRARVLVATSRVLEDLARFRVPLDAVVGSAKDGDERYVPGLVQPAPRLVVLTEGAGGGRWWTEDGEQGQFEAEPLPGPKGDAYGAGDSFAAGLTFALGAGYPVPEAVRLAARCGAANLTGRGPYEGQLTRADLGG